jgi:hypothetical protein
MQYDAAAYCGANRPAQGVSHFALPTPITPQAIRPPALPVGWPGRRPGVQ